MVMKILELTLLYKAPVPVVLNAAARKFEVVVAAIPDVAGVKMAETVWYLAPVNTLVVEEYREVVTTELVNAHAVKVVPLITYP